MRTPPSGKDLGILLYNLWTNPPAGKAIYLEQISQRTVMGEDGKIKEVQFTTIFVFSPSAKDWQRGWYITGELLRSGAMSGPSFRYITPTSWSKAAFAPKSDMYVYAWIDEAVAKEGITPAELAKLILPYRAFTFSILQQVQKQQEEQKPVEQIKKQPEEQKQST